jgi:hypothetical protein
MARTFKYRTLRDNVKVVVPFIRPLFDWENVSGRFFSLVYDALLGKIAVNPGDFSLNPANILSDVRAKYSIYGGATSVTLHADRLVFDFPNIIPSDYPTVTNVVTSIHDAFPKAFPAQQFHTLDVQTLEHMDLIDLEGVRLFLERFKVKASEESFASSVVIHPQVKFTALAQDQSWECSFAAERSFLSATALFTAIGVTLRRVDPSTPYADKAQVIRTVTRSCLDVVGLENANAPIK